MAGHQGGSSQMCHGPAHGATAMGAQGCSGRLSQLNREHQGADGLGSAPRYCWGSASPGRHKNRGRLGKVYFCSLGLRAAPGALPEAMLMSGVRLSSEPQLRWLLSHERTKRLGKSDLRQPQLQDTQSDAWVSILSKARNRDSIAYVQSVNNSSV